MNVDVAVDTDMVVKNDDIIDIAINSNTAMNDEDNIDDDNDTTDKENMIDDKVMDDEIFMTDIKEMKAESTNAPNGNTSKMHTDDSTTTDGIDKI